MRTTRKQRHRWVSIVILLAMVGLATWWIFTFPFRMERLWMAFPSECHVLSVHRELDSRWMHLIDNPVMRAILAASDPEDEPGDDELEISGWLNGLIRRLTRHPVLTGYTDSFAGTGRPAFIVAAWGGGYTQLLRWGWFDGALSSIAEKKRVDGQSIWTMPCPDLGPGVTVSLSCHEGVVVAVLSDFPDAVTVPLVRLIWGRRDRPEAYASAYLDEGMDRLTGQLYTMRDDILKAGAFHASLERIEAQQVIATMNGESPLFDPLPTPQQGVFDGLGETLQHAPCLLLTGSVQLLSTLQNESRTEWSSPYVSLFNRVLPADATCFLALSRKPYGGTLMKVRVPVLWAGVALPAASEVDDLVNPLLDLINAQTSLGFIPEPIGEGNHVHVLTSTRDSPYQRLERKERPAFAVRNNWLIISSNQDALMRLLQSPHVASEPRWLRTVEGAAVSLWADGGQVAALGREGMAAYTLVNMFINRSRGAQPDPELMQALFRGLETIPQIAMRLEVVSPTSTLSVLAGESGEWPVTGRSKP